GKHRVVADVVDVPRNSLRTLKDEVHCTGRKNIWLLRSRDQESLSDVPVDFFDRRKGMHVAPERDTLFKLAKILLIQLVAKLGLTRKNDLQVLCIVRFEV